MVDRYLDSQVAALSASSRGRERASGPGLHPFSCPESVVPCVVSVRRAHARAGGRHDGRVQEQTAAGGLQGALQGLYQVRPLGGAGGPPPANTLLTLSSEKTQYFLPPATDSTSNSRRRRLPEPRLCPASPHQDTADHSVARPLNESCDERDRQMPLPPLSH